MVTFLITSFLILGIIAIAIYFWQKTALNTDTYELPPPRPAGLFPNEEPSESDDSAKEQLLAKKQTEPQENETQLRARKEELNAFIESWRVSPDRKSTANMLHLAAAADNADTYREAVEVALSIWQRGGIPDLTAAELQNLFNSEFWLLSSRTRSSGAGFVLKQTLSRASRELEHANNPS
jgi:hypothetical protein